MPRLRPTTEMSTLWLSEKRSMHFCFTELFAILTISSYYTHQADHAQAAELLESWLSH